MRLGNFFLLVEGPPGDASWSKDYTQHIAARSILLDEALSIMAEEFIGLFAGRQIE
jgi:hypothetical protein